MPSLFACSENFAVAHALRCPKAEHTLMTHNELRNSFPNLATDIWDHNDIEPHLQPMQEKFFARKITTTDDAKLDLNICT